MTLGRGGHHLGPRVGQLHRRSQMKGRQGRGGERPDVLLAAETAADRRRDDADSLLRQTEDPGEVGAIPVRFVIRADHGDPPDFVDVADDGLALDRHVRLEARGVIRSDHDLRFAPGALAIAGPNRVLREQIPLGVDSRRVRLERARDLGGVRQEVVIDPHSLRAASRRLARCAQDQRDRIAEHPHRSADRREEMLVARIAAQAVFARDIRRGQHAHDARKFERGRNVDAGDARVKVGAADHANVMQVRHRDVFGEKRRAADEIPAFVAFRASADNGRIAGRRIVAIIAAIIAAHSRGGHLDRPNDLDVAGTATEVAVERGYDLPPRGPRVAVQQSLGGQKDAGGAIAALHRAGFQERGLQRMRSIATA